MAKTDQTNLFEKHVEKLALAAAGLILVLVVIAWVARPPVTGNIGLNAENVPPAEIDTALSGLAAQMKATIDRAPAEPAEAPRWAEEIASTTAQPFQSAWVSSPPPAWVPRGERIEASSETGPQKVASLPLAPPLGATAVWAGHETVLVGNTGGSQRGAVDTPVAHVTTVFDVDSLTQAWRQQLDGTGVRPELTVIRVSAERIELLPDGSWSEPVLLTVDRREDGTAGGLMRTDTTVPGLPRTLTTGAVSTALGGFSTMGVPQAVLQPSFYPVLVEENGVQQWFSWQVHLPRTPVNESQDAQYDPVTQWTAQPIVYERMTTGGTMGPQPGMMGPPGGMGGPTLGPPGGMGGPMLGPPGGMDGPMLGPPGGGGDMMMGPPGGMGGPTLGPPGGRGGYPTGPGRTTTGRPGTTGGAPTGPPPGIQQARQRTPQPGGYPGTAQPDAYPGTAYGQPQVEQPDFVKVPPLGFQFEDGLVQIWAHDISAEPGKTYQYRLRLEVVNPVFQQPLAVEDPQLAQVPVVMGISQWSAAVRVKPAVQFFIVGTSQDRVQVDVFRSHLGNVVRQRLNVRPGEPIGEPREVEYRDPSLGRPVKDVVDFSTGAVLVDYSDSGSVTDQRLGVPRKLVEAVVLTGGQELVHRDSESDRDDADRDEMERKASELNRWLSSPVSLQR